MKKSEFRGPSQAQDDGLFLGASRVLCRAFAGGIGISSDRVYEPGYASHMPYLLFPESRVIFETEPFESKFGLKASSTLVGEDLTFGTVAVGAEE